MNNNSKCNLTSAFFSREEQIRKSFRNIHLADLRNHCNALFQDAFNVPRFWDSLNEIEKQITKPIIHGFSQEIDSQAGSYYFRRMKRLHFFTLLFAVILLIWGVWIITIPKDCVLSIRSHNYLHWTVAIIPIASASLFAAWMWKNKYHFTPDDVFINGVLITIRHALASTEKTLSLFRESGKHGMMNNLVDQVQLLKNENGILRQGVVDAIGLTEFARPDIGEVKDTLIRVLSSIGLKTVSYSIQDEDLFVFINPNAKQKTHVTQIHPALVELDSDNLVAKGKVVYE